jgi:hypothetical protein
METLTYIRKATKTNDGHDGLLYRHTWATGFQELIFSSKEAADKRRAEFSKK